MTAQSRKRLYFVAGIAISVFLMWYLFRGIEFARLWTTLKSANYFWLIPNIFFVVFAMYQRAYRWRFMLAPVKRVSFSRLLSATCIGFMANNVLPLRLGEFVRAYSLSYQDRGVSKSASLATIFVERMVFDLVALLMIFGVVIGVTRVDISERMRTGIIISIAIALVGLAVVLVLALKPERTGDLLTRYLTFLPEKMRESLKSIILRFSTGLEFILEFKTAAWVGLQTLILWLFMGLSNYFVFLAFGFKLPLDASYFLLVVVSISILIPSSPGFIGVYHTGTVYTLLQYNISQADALSFALVLHAAQYIPITLMGFYYLRKSHLSLKQLEDQVVEDV